MYRFERLYIYVEGCLSTPVVVWRDIPGMFNISSKGRGPCEVSQVDPRATMIIYDQ